MAIDPEGRPVPKPSEVLPDSTVGTAREWQVIAMPKTFHFLLQILQNIFLGFPTLTTFNKFSLSGSAPKPKGSNNGDECVIISDSDEDEEQNSQNLGQEDDEGDDQVRGEFSFSESSHIV